MSNSKIPVVCTLGDGIGPEIMEATLSILEAANAGIEPVWIETGEKVYLSGNTSGIPDTAWDALRSAKVFLKAPITTPQGGGYKSLNVTLRKTLGLYANVRPCRSLYPYVSSKHEKLDIVIIRENEEDLYAGIEHRQTPEVYQCLKIITVPGTEKIIHYAFEYARSFGRKKVTCMVKDNIMKLTDGLYSTLFREIGKGYPEIEQELKIIDIGSAQLADTPERFDVIVTLNLYGDIISDIVAQIAGSVGLCGSSNIGEKVSMFEAIHGSAPDIAGKNIANPSGLLNGAILMLGHIGKNAEAVTIHNAWLKTLEDGIHTADIYDPKVSKQKVGTREFAQAVIDRLGQKPSHFAPVEEGSGQVIQIPAYVRKPVTRILVGADLFVYEPTLSANELGNKIDKVLLKSGLKLKMISNRGVKVYPDGHPETFCTDHWRCRIIDSDQEGKEYPMITAAHLLSIQQAFLNEGLEVIKTENLFFFGTERGFSLGQGE